MKKLTPKLEKLVALHAGELQGCLFMKVATDEPVTPPILLGPAPLDICKDVVRRIMVNALNAAKTTKATR